MMEEDYHKITYKSAAFFAIVDRVTRDLDVEYEYAMKTDDDSYVALDRIEMFLGHLSNVESVKPDYIGKCNKKVSPIRNSSHQLGRVSRIKFSNILPRLWFPCIALIHTVFVVSPQHWTCSLHEA